MDVFSHSIKNESDILAVRDRARVISSELGFTVPQQMQVTTSIFELGKNILSYAETGDITISLLTEDETLILEIVGSDNGPGIPHDIIDELLETKISGKTMRGIPAMKRMMDSIDIQSNPGSGSTITLTKRKESSEKTLTQNIVGFFQDKFSTRQNPTVSDEFELQTSSLKQTLSLYEEKNNELLQKNKELLELKQELESINKELEDQSAELQDALLMLGDRNAEVEERNQLFTLTLHHIQEGIVLTDRSGQVKIVNQPFLELTGKTEEEIIGIEYQEWCNTLSSFKTVSEEEWNKTCSLISQNDKDIISMTLHDENYSNTFQCKIIPVLGAKEKVYGRLWIFT